MAVGTIKLVFSWTKHQGRLFRHLSVSTTSSEHYPDPRIVWTIAHYCGFTGGNLNEQDLVFEKASTWECAPQDGGIIVVIEDIKDPPTSKLN